MFHVKQFERGIRIWKQFYLLLVLFAGRFLCGYSFTRTEANLTCKGVSMNKFNRQWSCLESPDPRAYYKLNNVSPVLLFQLLDYEKEKNGKLRKRINEQKQKIKSLERKLRG